MTDAQHLIDYARAQFNEIAEGVERHFDVVADSLRERFHTTLPPLTPSRRLPPPTTAQTVERWVLRNKALTAAAAAFLLTGSVGLFFHYAKSRDSRRKRRARKSPSGARTDVVIVAGAVANPLTSAVCLDLERRGYVVYVVSHTAEDEHYIRSHSRADLIPLSLDLVDPYTAQSQLAKLQNLFSRDHYAFDGARPHKLNFVGLVLAPDTQSEPAEVAEISSEEWSDALNAKVLNCIATTQLLLPAVIKHQAKVLLLTPSVAPALRLPLHSIETTVYGALQGFSTSLAAELKHDGVSLTHIKVGSVDIPSLTSKRRREGVPAPRFKPTPVRKLHDCVFDTLLARSPPSTLHVGRGSATYDLIGSWAPPAFIAWMMGTSRPSPAFKEDLQSSSGSLIANWDKIEMSDPEI